MSNISEIQSRVTETWDQLGNLYLRRFEFYDMDWMDLVDLDKSLVVPAPYGGYIAVVVDPRRLTEQDKELGAVSQERIHLYLPTGKPIAIVKWDGGSVAGMGWTQNEELIVVSEAGIMKKFDLLGRTKTQAQNILPQGQGRILEVQFFPTRYGTGVACLTTSMHFSYCTSINEPRMKTSAELPGMPEGQAPDCWVPLEMQDSVSILSSFNGRLFSSSVESADEIIVKTSCQGDIRWDRMALSIRTEASPQKLALFNSQQGWLWMGDPSAPHRQADLEVSLAKTKRDTPPSQICWLGTDAVALAWEHTLLVHSRRGEHWVKSTLTGPIVLLPEVDGIRILHPDKHEFIQRVITVSVQVFHTGSPAPGCILNDALKLYSQKEGHKADECIRLIKEKSEMEDAIKQCISAGTFEIDPEVQKSLFMSGAFGKSFLGGEAIPEDLIKRFLNSCKQLRVLNNINTVDVAIPMTYNQLNSQGLPELILRLVRRRMFFLAHHISSYLELPSSLGTHKVLLEWASIKLQQQEPDEVIAKQVLTKFRQTPGISYSFIAEKARSLNRPDLATLLLDEEVSASEQIPLLLDMGRDEIGLDKAIGSGDPDLVYSVIFRLQKKMTRGDFLLAIRNRPTARNLYLDYCKKHERTTLYYLFQQDDMFLDSGMMRVEETNEYEMAPDKKKLLVQARTEFQNGNLALPTALSEDYIRLYEKQKEIEEVLANRVNITGLTVTQTLEKCFVYHRPKEAESIRKEFRVSDNQFYWTKIKTIAALHDWGELDKLSRSKKPVIGYEPFVEVCLKNGSRSEAIKYCQRVSIESRGQAYLKCDALREAADAAFQCKDLSLLETILQKGSNDRDLVAAVRQQCELLQQRN